MITLSLILFYKFYEIKDKFFYNKFVGTYINSILESNRDIYECYTSGNFNL